MSIAFPVVILWSAGGMLKNVSWTQTDGETVRVSVIQGNIPQKDKWKLHMKQPTMNMYRDMSLAQQDVD